MHKILIGCSLLLALSACKNMQRVHYKVIPDSKTKVIKGIVNQQVIASDTAFSWFTQNQQYGTANAPAVQAFKQYGKQFTMLVFGGTWCSDTQNLWPVFFRLVNKSNYPQQNITLIAVDRDKTTFHGLHKKYHITNVPTFIVLKKGQEIGRIVEYGTKDFIDEELGIIVNRAFAPLP